MTAVGLVAVTGGILSMWAGLTGQSIGETLRAILSGKPVGQKPLSPADQARAEGKGGASSRGGGGGFGGGGITAT